MNLRNLNTQEKKRKERDYDDKGRGVLQGGRWKKQAIYLAETANEAVDMIGLHRGGRRIILREKKKKEKVPITSRERATSRICRNGGENSMVSSFR